MKTLLFNPGPTNVADEVRDALKTRDICHREIEFREALLSVNERLVRLLGGENTHSAVMFVSSATGCNEAIIGSIRGKALVVNNGKYSDRLCDILERFHVPFTRVVCDPLKPVDIEKVERAIASDLSLTHVFVVHHETTTGVLAPLNQIGRLAKKYGKVFAVDAVSSIGGHPFHLQNDYVDFCSVSANKCLESFPGVSFVLARTDQLEKLEGLARSYYFDLYSHWKKQQNGDTPFTPAVQLVFAMDAALNRLEKEGYVPRVERYKALALRMREGLRHLGFELLLLPDELQSNILTAVKMPKGMNYWRVHDKLKTRGITIYSDKSVLSQGKFRVATLGSIETRDVDNFLKNLKEVMAEEGL